MLGRPVDAILAALAMGIAGAVLRGSRVGWRALGCATTVLGGIAGMFAGSFAGGVMLGLLAMFPLRLVAWAAEGGSARRGSLLDAVDIRQAWGVAAVLVTVVPSPLLAISFDLPGLRWLFGAGALILMWVTAADVRAFLALGKLAAQASQGQPAPLYPVQKTVPVADVGIGERQHELRLPGTPYRGGHELVSVVRGDAAEARRRLFGRLVLDAMLAGSAVLLFASTLGSGPGW